MKSILALACLQLSLALLPLGARAEAPLGAAQQKTNYQAARAYYQQLLADKGRVAELGMLMNMLPKGGDLHHHYTGALYAETYLDWVDRQKYCVYQATLRIETKPEQAQPGAACLSGSQIKDDNALYRKLLTLWSDKDFDNHSHDQPPPDKQFFDTFGYFGGVSGYSPREGLQLLKTRAKAENLQYLETMLRGAPSGNSALAANLDSLAPDAAPAAIEQALGQAASALAADASTAEQVQRYRQDLAGFAQGMDDDDFTLRFQTYVSRNNKPSITFA
ncbi:hypothetical protein, partial [Chromobacterium subtsugae]